MLPITDLCITLDKCLVELTMSRAVSITAPDADSNKMARFHCIFLSAPLVSYPLIILQEHIAMIHEVHVVHVTRHIERSEPQRKSLPIEIVTNQRDALYAPPK